MIEEREGKFGIYVHTMILQLYADDPGHSWESILGPGCFPGMESEDANHYTTEARHTFQELLV